MVKKRIIFTFILLCFLMVIFLPGYSRLQRLRTSNMELASKIEKLEDANRNLQEERDRLLDDPVYIEGVARENLRLSKEGEVIYKIIEE